MAKGRPGRWAVLKIKEDIELKKKGVEVKIWDKYSRKIKGKVIISIGGIRWFARGKQYPTKIIPWNDLMKK